MLFSFFPGHILPIPAIEGAHIHRGGPGRVLPAAVELRVRADAGRAATQRPHPRHHTQHSHLPHLYYILQCLRNGCGCLVPMFP